MGIVSDSSKPLAMATVRIFKKDSKAPLQTTLSKESGNFEFNKPAPGNYLLSFTHTGFAEKQINITVGPEAADMNIERVQLSRTTGTLKEVVVSGQRPLVNNSDAINNQYTIQADNSIPLKKNGMLEGGVKAILQ